jgi:iron complex transport system substrate-binding protein
MRLVLLIILFTFSLNATSFTDMYKRDIQIKDNKKIVCLGPGTLRLVTYMQLQNRLLGIEKSEFRFSVNSPYSLALDKDFIKTLPVIGQGGPGKMPNLETLITLKPDIIFSSLLSKEQIQLIQEKTKVPVVALSYGSTYGGNNKNQSKLEAIKDSLTLIGKIMNKEKRAKELISFMNEEENKLAKISIDDKAIYVGGVAYKGLHGITSTESDYPAFLLLNIKNRVLKDHIGHAFINKETLLEFNPEVVFLDSISKKIVLEEIKKDSVIFNHIKAFKKKNIYWLYPSNFYNTNIENIYINSWQIASYFGNDIDMDLVKKRVYKAFLGKDIDSHVQ